MMTSIDFGFIKGFNSIFLKKLENWRRYDFKEL
jgi:hypothetical protein